MSAATNDRYEEALRLFDAGNFRGAHEAALSGLSSNPKDASLLRVAGRAGVELDMREATEYLQRACDLEPDNADAWRELADALLYDGRAVEATAALRRAAELQPDDADVLLDLAHAARAAGNADEATGYVEQAVERDAGSPAALRALIEVHRAAGRSEDALDAASRLAEAAPDDVNAALEVADLNLELGRADEAAAAFSRLRQIDDDPEHEVYAYHGMIQAEIKSDRWRRALAATGGRPTCSRTSSRRCSAPRPTDPRRRAPRWMPRSRRRRPSTVDSTRRVSSFELRGRSTPAHHV